MIKKKFLFWEYDVPKTINGSLNLCSAGWLNEENTLKLLNCADRYERIQDPVIYIKAMRCTLLALGFDSDWVENDFRNMAEKVYLR